MGSRQKWDTSRAGVQTGLECRQGCSGRTWLTIWFTFPQATPISQAPGLLPGPLLASSHPLPTLPLSSSAFSPSLFLPSFFSSSSVNHLPFLHILPQNAHLLFFCSFFPLLSAFLHRSAAPFWLHTLLGIRNNKAVVTLIQVKILHAAFLFPSRI